MSETRKPAPSAWGAKKDRDEIDRAFAKAESAIFNVELCADCSYPKDDSRFHFEAPGTNWGAALHFFRAPDAGAPASPALPQSNLDGGQMKMSDPKTTIQHNSERTGYVMTTNSRNPGIPLKNLSGEKTYTQTELNTLLDSMARSVVEEAAKLCSVAEEVGRCNPPCHAIDRDKILAMLTPEKLTQLREAVQRG